ncbi:hypothetical protein FOL47_009468, partial [Perkinsus chesapeaki]
ALKLRWYIEGHVRTRLSELGAHSRKSGREWSQKRVSVDPGLNAYYEWEESESSQNEHYKQLKKQQVNMQLKEINAAQEAKLALSSPTSSDPCLTARLNMSDYEKSNSSDSDHTEGGD